MMIALAAHTAHASLRFRAYPLVAVPAIAASRSQCSSMSEVAKAQIAAPGGDTIFGKVRYMHATAHRGGACADS